VECRFECECAEGVEARCAGCVMLVLILGLVEDGVEFEGPGEGEGEGEGEGDGFRVGNVNVGNISDVDAGADSDGTSN